MGSLLEALGFGNSGGGVLPPQQQPIGGYDPGNAAAINFLTSGSILGGIGNAIAGATTGQRTDPSYLQQQQYRGAEAAGQAGGLSPDAIRGLALNPDAMKAVWGQQKPVVLPYGGELVNPNTGEPVNPIASGGSLREQANTIAEGIKNGSQPPDLKSMYRTAPAIRAKLQEGGFDLAKAQLQWAQAQKQIQSLNGPQMTRFVGLAGSVDRTIDEVNDLASQMKLGGIPLLNKGELAAYIQTQGNSPNGQLATRYVTAINTLKEEFANLANGGYAPTEPAWKLANQQIEANYGDKQLAASLTEVQRLIRYRLQAIPNINTLGPGSANQYTGNPGLSTGASVPEAPKAVAAPEAIPVPSAPAIELLRKNPAYVPQFEKKYGPGSAKKYLNQRPQLQM